MKLKLKKDKFSKSREGTSKLYTIKCSKCNSEVAVYQKDGIGSLIRMYLDRFILPKELVESLDTYTSVKAMKPLKCNQCNNIIGMPMIYEKESRLAYRIVPGSLVINKNI